MHPAAFAYHAPRVLEEALTLLPVAVALAPTPAAAEDLAAAVELEIGPSPPVVGLEAALAAGARRVHETGPSNVLVDARHETAAFAAATAAAGSARVAVDFRSHRQSALPLETRAAHAAPDAATSRVTLTCTTRRCRTSCRRRWRTSWAGRSATCGWSPQTWAAGSARRCAWRPSSS